MSEFEAFPKIHRLKQSVVVTEKIDGSNAQVYIVGLVGDAALDQIMDNPYCLRTQSQPDGSVLAMYAGSRTRWIRPGKTDDNFGFAQWVVENSDELFKLGLGRHYGEWYGAGIQSGYGLSQGYSMTGAPVPDRRFALFNTARWGAHNPGTPACCQVVPVLAIGDVDTDAIMKDLKYAGSVLVPGFMEPEGIVVYYAQARTYAKRTFIADGGKWSLNGQ